MQHVLITGAGRGLGLELARLYAAHGWVVYAGCRSDAAGRRLREIAGEMSSRLEIVQLDVAKAGDIAALKDHLRDTPIDLLLHVAGYFGSRSLDESGGMAEFGQTDYEDWDTMFSVNVTGVMRISEALAANVAASAGRKIVAISSRMGSIGGNSGGKMYGYRASKAALNAIIQSMAVDLADRGISTLCLHPGWVKTAMGGRNAILEPEQAARDIKDRIDALSLEVSGRFLDHDGTPIPW